MLPTLKEIKSFFHLETVATDNAVFRLHYKVTVMLLALSSLLLGAKQYFGDPITCKADPSSLNNFMDVYCWVSGTWTIKEYTYDSVQHIVSLNNYANYPFTTEFL